jgi:mono/diheme cytochrome c family protein
MLKKILMWLLIVIGVVIIVIVVAVFTMSSNIEKRRTTQYKLDPIPLEIPSDSASLVKGERWAGALCAGCHDYDFGGKDLINDEAIGRIVSPNITSGRGGLTAGYGDKDWLRVIRHGVKPTGMPAMGMPSQDFHNMSDEDVGSIIAYMKTVPPVDREFPYEPKLTTMAKVLAKLGAFGDLFAAEVIDHNATIPVAPVAAASAEYGEYLSSFGGCTVCHGLDLNGGASPEPESPPGPNLTPGGNIGNWTAEQFVNTFRTGTTPEGHKMDPKYMPWKSMRSFNDTELEAIYTYLRSLPAAESAVE